MAEEDGEEFEWWWWWWKKREEDGGGEGSRKWGLVYLALGGWAAQVIELGRWEWEWEWEWVGIRVGRVKKKYIYIL